MLHPNMRGTVVRRESASNIVAAPECQRRELRRTVVHFSLYVNSLRDRLS